MREFRSIPLLGSACVSHVGDRLTGEVSPIMLHYQKTQITTPYFALGDDREREERQLEILEAVVERALLNSGLHPQEIAKTGLFMGSSSYDLRTSELAYRRQLDDQEQDAVPVMHTGSCRLSDWVGRRFSIVSDPFNINTACTSSANALLLAQEMLQQGIIKHALVIGLELFNETTLCGFAGLQLLATEHLCPFDKEREGLLLGEGCAAVVLGSDDRDCEFRLAGGGTSFDPHSITGANEDGTSIAAALRSALHASGCAASEILAIKLQGSGSLSNDLAEGRGLALAFGREMPLLTGIKPYIGHTLGACGVLELVLFCRSLADGYIPATPNFTHPDPVLAITPLTSARPALAGTYLLNTFGFGGNNTVLALEKRH
ncbi:MAG: beta-ketoacyl synthase N-terminal-like domain-containing protein [Gammaproteobacteria bacterium]|nr:beta-ketoacyl synthase N-terminal-like domain-containing protein [Gammaproteobacteria bacterium]